MALWEAFIQLACRSTANGYQEITSALLLKPRGVATEKPVIWSIHLPPRCGFSATSIRTASTMGSLGWQWHIPARSRSLLIFPRVGIMAREVSRLVMDTRSFTNGLATLFNRQLWSVVMSILHPQWTARRTCS